MRTLNHVSDGDLKKTLANLRRPEHAPRVVRSILTEAEAYDLLQEELCGLTAEDLEPEPTAEERELDRWLNADPESFYGYLPRNAR